MTGRMLRTKGIAANTLTVLFVVLTLLIVGAQVSYADDITSGNYANVDWRITSDYELIIGKSGETQQFKFEAREHNYVVRQYPWLNQAYQGNIKSVSFEGTVKGNGTMAGMFYFLEAAESIDLTNFDTSAVTDMHEMFSYCKKLKTISLSGLDTSNVVDMHSLFANCDVLETINLTGINTSSVLYMENMFSSCPKLVNLDVSSLDTSKVMYMTSMFDGCTELPVLNVSIFNTSNVKSMGGMFSGCQNVAALDVSGFNTEKVTSMSAMFNDCESVAELDVSGFDTSLVTDMSYMFSRCYKVYDLDLSDFDTSSVTRMVGMFSYLGSGVGVTITDENADPVYENGEANYLMRLDLSSFDTTNVQDMSEMFKYAIIGSVDLSTFDTKNVLNMEEMFADCHLLKSLDLSKFNTGRVHNMQQMFEDVKLEQIDVSKLSTGSVKNMNGMFNGCSNLTSINLSNFNTMLVEDMGGMFSGCRSLTSIDISGFDTTNVTNMSSMFYMCNKLETVKINGLVVTSKLTAMQSMFWDCKALKEIDLSGFDLSGITRANDINRLFYNCDSLETVKAPKNLVVDCALPITMYDPDGTEYDYLPQELTASVTLTKDCPDPVIPDDPDPDDPGVFYGPVRFGNHTYAKNLDYYAENLGTSQFNKNLCALMCGLSCSAYSKADVVAAFRVLGFAENEYVPYNYPDNVSDYDSVRNEITYTIGKKTNANGTTIVLVDIRGTDLNNLSDKLHDVMVTGLDNNYSTHRGFQIAADQIMQKIDILMGGEATYDPNVKYFITGHSLGAATGNLLAAKLSSYVGKDSVYNYNFACPDTTVSRTSILEDPSAFNQQSSHSNMFNICRTSDKVPYVPGLAGSMLLEAKESYQYGWDVLQVFHTNADYYWGKFGITKWFNDGITGLADAHDQNKYLDYVCSSNATFVNANRYRDAYTYTLNNAFIFCPVDAELVNSNGAVVASIINNTPAYANNSFGEVIIQTCDDKKCISYPAGKGYSLRLKATGSGTMDFILARGTPDSTKFDAAKVYQNATLTNGKEMAHQGAEGSTITDSKLTVLGTDGNATAEIKEDGSETAIPPAGGGSSGGGSAGGGGGGGGGAGGDTPSTDADKTAADTVIKAINDLPATITLENEAAVVATRTAYAALTEAQKALVSAEILAKLEQAEATITNWQQYNTNVAAAKNATSKIIKVKNQKLRKAIITWQNTDGCTGYTIAYTTDKKFKKGIKRKTAKAGTTKLTLKKLKKGKTYYFKVQPYTNVTNHATGEVTKVAGKWSKAKKLKIKR